MRSLLSSRVLIVAECLPLLRCFTHSFKEKQRQATRTPNVVFVVASHYQSLQIVVLLLQACLLGSLALSRTLLLQQLQGRSPNSVPVEKTVWRPFYILVFAVWIEFAMLLLALYKSYVSQSGVSIFYQNGRKVELVFVRMRFKLHISLKRLVERIQMFSKAIRLCVGISLVRKRLKALYELSNVLQTFQYCVHKINYAR